MSKKLSCVQVSEIKQLIIERYEAKFRNKYIDISKQYRVTPMTILMIDIGQTHKKIKPFTDQQIKNIEKAIRLNLCGRKDWIVYREYLEDLIYNIDLNIKKIKKPLT